MERDSIKIKMNIRYCEDVTGNKECDEVNIEGELEGSEEAMELLTKTLGINL